MTHEPMSSHTQSASGLWIPTPPTGPRTSTRNAAHAQRFSAPPLPPTPPQPQRKPPGTGQQPRPSLPVATPANYELVVATKDGWPYPYGRLIDGNSPTGMNLYQCPCPSHFSVPPYHCEGPCTVWFSYAEIDRYERFAEEIAALSPLPPLYFPDDSEDDEPFTPRLGPECCVECALKVVRALEAADGRRIDDGHWTEIDGNRVAY